MKPYMLCKMIMIIVLMKIDDKVITFQGEKGVILRPWNRDDGQYDWWVELKFTIDDKEYTSIIPYKESELTGL